MSFKVLLLLVLAINATMGIDPIVLVHGGAGDIPDDRDPGKFSGTKLAARIGYQTLLETGSVLEAVEIAVKSMELDANFNCGYGSVLTINGTVEMDASIMDGRDLSAGCVSNVKNIFHPISLAKRVMEETPHTFIGGEPIMDLAKLWGFQILPEGSLVAPRSREALDEFIQSGSLGKSEVGTVGAVAIDADGNLAAATSTGGITGKYQGRIGDSPILGSGTYADNRFGAVSSTGHGESIMKFNLAKDIIARMEFLNLNAQEATTQSLAEMFARTGQTAGAITLDKEGNIGMDWTSDKMSYAFQRQIDQICYGIKTWEDPFCDQISKDDVLDIKQFVP